MNCLGFVSKISCQSVLQRTSVSWSLMEFKLNEKEIIFEEKSDFGPSKFDTG